MMYPFGLGDDEGIRNIEKGKDVVTMFVNFWINCVEN
jgi:hypothetical protein